MIFDMKNNFKYKKLCFKNYVQAYIEEMILGGTNTDLQ